MTPVIHPITIESAEHFGGKLPTHELGSLLKEFPGLVRSAIAMALRNRSTQRGKRPVWLDRAADIRFVAFTGTEPAELFIEAPKLGEAAEELYRPGELWTTRPDAGDTGIDLLGDLLCDVAQENADSEKFDTPLLHRLLQFKKVFEHRFQAVRISRGRLQGSNIARLS